MTCRALLSCIPLLLAALPATAHHSYAMFDQTKLVTMSGTVKEMQWTNPHCFLQVLVPAQNAVAEWSIEMLSPSAMFRAGWRPTTFKRGDKVTVVINPVRNGANAGYIVSATDATGRLLVPKRPRS